jgi:hypothetical protein
LPATKDGVTRAPYCNESIRLDWRMISEYGMAVASAAFGTCIIALVS